METSKLRNLYLSDEEKYSALLEKDGRVLLILSLFRLITFFAGLAVTILAFRLGSVYGFAVLATIAIVFGFLLKAYSSRSWQKRFNANMLEITREEIQSVDGNYRNFRGGEGFIDQSHTFSHDIDLFGKGSVFQALNRTVTAGGEICLANWLKTPFDLRNEFEERQEAIQELAGMTEWRHIFLSLGRMNKTSVEEDNSFKSWMSERTNFLDSTLYRLMLVAMPAMSIISLSCSIAGLLPFSIFITFFLLNLLLVASNLRKINTLHSKISKKSSYLNVVSSLIGHIESQQYRSKYLENLKSGLGSRNITAIDRIKRLARLLHSFDSRLNLIMGVVLNGLFLWDYQCISRIEKWKKSASLLVPGWFATLDTTDAIISLACYTCNNPGYAVPEIAGSNIVLEAKAMGHHLIPSDKRITNDYSLGERGSINIITGANMAGKSTFLRTVAVNFVLAMCGVPVCAERFVFRPVKLFTSMRTSDSLSEEESYFFAELKRLRQLVNMIAEDENVFFVLDEILKGTNSRDKSEGSKAFIEKLVKMNATGMIATHDISLGELENRFPGKVSNNCFEVIIENGDIEFDFILRKGITTRMNAALLMKQQGII